MSLPSRISSNYIAPSTHISNHDKLNKPNILVRIWRAVCRFFKNLFQLMGFIKKPIPRLNPEQIRRLNEIQHQPPPPLTFAATSTPSRISLTRALTSTNLNINNSAIDNPSQYKQVEPPQFIDPSLQQLCQLTSEGIPEVVDALAEKIKPGLEEAQQKATLVLDVVNKALGKAVNLSAEIEKYKQPVLIPLCVAILNFAIEKPSKRTNPTAIDFPGKKILNLFLNKPDNFRASIEKKFVLNCETEDERVHRKLILDQFFQHTETEQPSNSSQNSIYNLELLDKIFEETIKLCIEEKIDNYLKLAESIFGKNLPNILSLLQKLANNHLTTANSTLKAIVLKNSAQLYPLLSKYLSHNGSEESKKTLKAEASLRIKESYAQALAKASASPEEKAKIEISDSAAYLDTVIDRFLLKLNFDFEKEDIKGSRSANRNAMTEEFLHRIMKSKETLLDAMTTVLTIFASNASNILTGRLAGLIGNLKFPDTIDNVARIMLQQVREEMIANDKARKDIKQIKAQPRGASPETDRFIDDIKRTGEKKFQEKLIAKIFAEQPHCHPIIRQMHGRNEKSAHELEVEYYSTKVDQIVNLLFPKPTSISSTAESKDTDGITQFCTDIIDLNEVPKEIADLFKEMISLSQQILFYIPTQDDRSGPMILQDLLVSLIQPKIKQLISEKIYELFETLTSPKHIERIMADTILPSIQVPLMKAFINQIILINIKKLNPLFYKITHASLDWEAENDKLKRKLLKLVKNKFMDYKLAQEGSSKGINEKQLKIIIENIINDTVGILRTTKDASEENFTAELHENTLYSHLMGVNNDDKVDVYGRVTRLLIFKMGNLKIVNNGFLNYVAKPILNSERVKSIIDAAICNAVNPIRTSHHFITNSIILALQNIFSNPEKLKSLITQTQSTASNEPASQKIKEGFEGFSPIIHDLIIRAIEHQTHFTVGPTSKELSRVMQLCFKRLLGNHDLNRNLLYSTMDSVLNALTEAGKRGNAPSLERRNIVALPATDDDITSEI
jgi:hypothetical protein